MDSIEAKFKGLAQLKGAYTNILSKGKITKFNSLKESLLKRRRDLIPTRDVDYSGSAYGYGSGRGYSVSFDLTWNCDSLGRGSVSIGNLWVSNIGFCESNYNMKDTHFYTSGGISISFSFDIVFNDINLTLNVEGYYANELCSVYIK